MISACENGATHNVLGSGMRCTMRSKRGSEEEEGRSCKRDVCTSCHHSNRVKSTFFQAPKETGTGSEDRLVAAQNRDRGKTHNLRRQRNEERHHRPEVDEEEVCSRGGGGGGG